MSFRIHLQNHKVWRKIIEAVSGVTEQAVFKATSTGVTMRMMDPIRVMMLDLELPANSFTEYKCTGDTKIAFAIEDMARILRRGQGDDPITLENHPDKKTASNMLITFQGTVKRTFTLALLDTVTVEDLSLPKLDSSSVSARLTFEALETAVRDAKVPSGSDQVTIRADDGEALTIWADGDTGDMTNEFRRGSEALLDLEVKEKAASRYATNYLEDMLKADGLGETALLQFSTDLPLKVTVMTAEGGRLVYYLAPRRET